MAKTMRQFHSNAKAGKRKLTPVELINLRNGGPLTNVKKRWVKKDK